MSRIPQAFSDAAAQHSSMDWNNRLGSGRTVGAPAYETRHGRLRLRPVPASKTSDDAPCISLHCHPSWSPFKIVQEAMSQAFHQ